MTDDTLSAVSKDSSSNDRQSSQHPTFKLLYKQRLNQAASFNRVFNDNKRSRDQYFVVLARANTLPYARLGLAVSRKVAGDAVPRNRLKRLIRESFRQHQPFATPFDCVVMARPGAIKNDNATLLMSLDNHWNRVTKLCAK